MRKFYLILAITLFPSFLFCQSIDDEGIDSKINYRWDSVANDWVVENRIDYRRDSLGNPVEEIHYNWDSVANDWVVENRIDYRRDSLGNPVEETHYNWDLGRYEWIPEKLYKQTYDSSGNVIVRDVFAWDVAGKEWKPAIEECDEGWYGDIYCYDFGRTEIRYDTAGNMTEMIQYSWDTALGSYIGYDRSFSEFDESGTRTSDSYFKWDTIGNKWILESQFRLLFDSAGNDIEHIGQEFDITTGDTVGGWRDSNVYDSLGNQIESTGYYWDADSNGWVQNSRTEYYYDSLGNQIKRIYYRWNTDINDWVLFSVTDYRYDSLGFEIENTHCAYWDWNDDKEMCDLSERFTYAYDVYGNLTERILYYKMFPAGDFIPESREENFYDSTGNLIEETYSRWELGSWEIYSNCVSVFDSAGNKIEESCREQDYSTYEPTGFKTVWSWPYDLIWDQVISAAENCQDCSVLAPVITGSDYLDEQLIMDLTSGNDHNLFALDTVGGDFVLVQDSVLDFETTSIHHLTIEAQFEDSTGTRTDSATMTVYVRNVNDNAPVLNDTTVTVSEDIQQTSVLCAIQATDADGDLDTLKFNISAGNGSGIFRCDQNGTIMLELFDSINYENQESYSLTVQVTDGIFRDEGIVFIEVLDVDETSVGTVDAGDKLKIFPNPAKNILYLKVPAGLLNGFETIITNLSGSVVYHQSGYIESIDLTSMPEGLYFITIRSKDFITTRKIIKL